MISKTLAAGLIAVGCVTAAGSGAYLAVRQNNAEPVAAAAPISPMPVHTCGNCSPVSKKAPKPSHLSMRASTSTAWG